MSLAAVPFGVAVYQYTNADGNSYFTRTISDTYLDYKAKFAQRNELHTTAMEQAAADRVLFLNETPKQPRWVDLRFPEYVPSLVHVCVADHPWTSYDFDKASDS